MAYEGTIDINTEYDHAFYGMVETVYFTLGIVHPIEFEEEYNMTPIVVFKVADRQNEVYAQTESFFRERIGQ